MALMRREMREESRRARTYGMRLAVALSGLLVFMVTSLWAMSGGLPDSILGRVLFGNLQAVLFCLIWLVVPFLTADTLSRERREGTLGLLFLTPLRPADVVAGKTAVHWIRAVSMMAAAAPLLAIPWLLGGVTWSDYVSALLVDFTSVCLALSVGLTASAYSTAWGKSMALAALLAVLTLGLYLVAYAAALSGLATTGPVGLPLRAGELSEKLLVGFAALTGVMGIRGSITGWIGGRAWLILNLEVATLALLVMLLVPRLVAYRLRTILRDEERTTAWTHWVQAWAKPRYARDWFRRRLSRALNRNPVGWLHQRRTSARMTKWTWCLVVVLAEPVLLAWGGWDTVPWAQLWLGLIMALGLSMSASGSFREERENGAFELLLVTPLREWDLIWGRLRGLWMQFLPGFALVFLVAMWWSSMGPVQRLWWDVAEEAFCRDLPWLLAGLFVALPAIGLWSSLVRRTVLGGWLSTVVWGIGVPALAAFTAVPSWGFRTIRDTPWTTSFVATLVTVQLVVAAVVLQLLYARLRRRDFGLMSPG